MSELFTLFTAKVKQMRHAQGKSEELMATAVKQGWKLSDAERATKLQRELEHEVDILIQEIEQEFSHTQTEALQQ